MPPVKVPGVPDNYYQSLSAAYTSAFPGSSLTMEAQAITFSENFNLYNTVNLLLAMEDMTRRTRAIPAIPFSMGFSQSLMAAWR